MRTNVTLGVLSLAAAAAIALVGCGDDEGDGPSQGGSGGSAGSGGGAGSGGMGMGGMGGSGGAQGGSGGMGGSGGGATATCTGCAVLEVPFSAPSQTAGYQLSLPAPGLDLSTAVITFNVQVYTPNPNLTIQLTVQNQGGVFPGYYGAPQVALTPANFPAGMFAEVSVDMSTVPGPVFLGGDAGVADAGDAGPTADPAVFDKTSADLLNFQFGSNAMFTGTFDAVVALDSIEITNVPGYTGVTFNAGVDGLRLNTYTGSTEPMGTPMPRAQ
jgi:hypothetical protein